MAKKTKKWVLGLAGAVGLIACAAAGVMTYVATHSPFEPEERDMIVDAATRTAVIEGVISSLNQAYVFPETAAAIEKGLRRQQQRGEFDSLRSANALARTLTGRLKALAHGDQHLEVRYFARAQPEPSPGGEASAAEQAALALKMRRLNAGLETVGRFRGNIGYLELRKFWRPKDVAPKLPAAMKLLADTAALIIDLRDCGGGDPETVMLVASYLFDQPTHLNDVYWRDENRLETRWTSATVEGDRYGGRRKIYVLISGETASGCEDFAYALKNTGRATLIGETTAGAAHAGSPKRLTEHFMMFVPTGRPVSPVTHTDWEGVGVTPDVKAPAAAALKVAQVAALKGLIAAETDMAWREKLEHTVRELE